MMRGEVWPGRGGRAAGDRNARSVQGRGLDCRLGAGHGEEHTTNIWVMSVALEVSKLSGWLNFAAYCRESKGGHMMRGEVRAGRAGGRRVTAMHAAGRGEGSTAGWAQGAGRSARRTWRAWL